MGDVDLEHVNPQNDFPLEAWVAEFLLRLELVRYNLHLETGSQQHVQRYSRCKFD